MREHDFVVVDDERSARIGWPHIFGGPPRPARHLWFSICRNDDGISTLESCAWNLVMSSSAPMSKACHESLLDFTRRIEQFKVRVRPLKEHRTFRRICNGSTLNMPAQPAVTGLKPGMEVSLIVERLSIGPTFENVRSTNIQQLVLSASVVSSIQEGRERRKMGEGNCMK